MHKTQLRSSFKLLPIVYFSGQSGLIPHLYLIPSFDIPLLKFCSSPSKFAVNYHHYTSKKGGSQTPDTVSKTHIIEQG